MSSGYDRDTLVDGGMRSTALGRVSDFTEDSFADWLPRFIARFVPRQRSAALAYWQATATGQPEEYQCSARASLALAELFSASEDFQFLTSVKKAGRIIDPLLERQLDLLYFAFLGHQYNSSLHQEIVQLSTSIQEKVNTFQVTVDNRVLTDNDVESCLRISADVNERRAVWEASKRIGEQVGQDAIRLVKLRNCAARELGYANYYDLSVALGEIDGAWLESTLDEVASCTDAPFRNLKAQLDQVLADQYGTCSSELRPWHYEDRFFQKPPSAGLVNTDGYFAGRDVVELALSYYDSLGLPARAIAERSDMYGRPGKYQHAYCTDIDRQGDVRVMMSARSDTFWMTTTLHELGHAVYSVAHDGDAGLPTLLRVASHTLTTEGVAQLMGRMCTNPHWLQRFIGISEQERRTLEPTLRLKERLGTLVFARWCLVMSHFEHQLYRDPDQDLNGLWWALIKRYQLLDAPERLESPDWASKIHIFNAPVYYHNYLLGELYGAQLHAAICRRYYPGEDARGVTYADRPDVGKYLIEKVFRPGGRWRWDRFVIESTGVPLSVEAFAEAHSS